MLELSRYHPWQGSKLWVPSCCLHHSTYTLTAAPSMLSHFLHILAYIPSTSFSWSGSQSHSSAIWNARFTCCKFHHIILNSFQTLTYFLSKIFYSHLAFTSLFSHWCKIKKPTKCCSTKNPRYNTEYCIIIIGWAGKTILPTMWRCSFPSNKDSVVSRVATAL